MAIKFSEYNMPYVCIEKLLFAFSYNVIKVKIIIFKKKLCGKNDLHVLAKIAKVHCL